MDVLIFYIFRPSPPPRPPNNLPSSRHRVRFPQPIFNLSTGYAFKYPFSLLASTLVCSNELCCLDDVDYMISMLIRARI